MGNILKKGLITGLGIGMFMGDTLGAAIGTGVGYVADKLMEDNGKDNNVAYTNFIGMTVAMAKVDGHFDDNEQEKILEYIRCIENREVYEIVYEEYNKFINMKTIDFISLAKEYDQKVQYDKEDREFIYSFLFELACIDNTLDVKEKRLLKALPNYFKLDKSIYTKMEEEFLPKPLSTEKLEDLIGLHNVKENISSIINSIKIEKLRGGKTIAGHYIFQGNPGTGKTTVARILGNKFKELSLLSKGQFIEVKREDFVGEYQGHTAIKTKEILNKSLGGVLFIDEVYSLKNGNGDDFGMEAINTIVPFIEDNRDKLIVIIAGYTQPMNEFLSTNPGLKSRFNHTIDFEDYNQDEMYQIFKLIAKDFTWDSKTANRLIEHFRYIEETKDNNFGNARDVRKVFDEIKKYQINRLINYDDLSEQDPRLNIFEECDIQF